MRPLKLIVTGFGTYCKRTEINLESLGTSGLYLIAGDTGAGKTTIFDAITYALYGTVNGKYRDVSMIRSTFATPDIPTEVELTFEYRDKIYTVKRNPEYERRSKRGDSITKQTADATFEKPDGTVVTQSSKVTQAVTELLGIDANQFSKIVMIAQGDFQQLLVEGTDRRQEIFRKIFKTDYYQKLQQALSEKEKELDARCDKIRQDLSHYINDTVCADTSTNSIELTKAKNGELAGEQLLELIQKIIDEDSAQKKALEEDIKQQEEKLSKITALLAKNEDFEKHKADYEQKKLELDEVNKAAALAQTEFENQKKLTGEREKKEADAAVQKERLSSYDKLEELEQLKNRDKQAFEQKQLDLNELAEAVEQAAEQKDALNSQFKELSDCEQNVNDLSNKNEKLEERKNQLVSLETKVKECGRALQKYNDCQEQYKSSMERWETLDEAYRAMRKIYMDEQAGILAEELKENTPCPVCGSLAHPSPAKKSEVAPTKEELDNAEKKAQDAKQTSELENAACVKAKSDYENLEKNIKEESARLFDGKQDVDEEALASSKNELDKELASLRRELEQEKARVETKKNIEKQLPALEQKIEKDKEKQSQLQSEISAVKERLEQYEKQLGELTKSLEYKSKSLAEDTLIKLENEILKLKNDFNAAQENNSKLKSKVDSLTAEINQLEQMINEAEKVDATALKEQKAELQEKKAAATDQKGLVDTRLDRNTHAVQNIKNSSGNLAELEKQYQSVSALSKTANGNLMSGKEKIKLETYIQMTYFDRIIAHANKRLMIMSDMQYELVRKKEASDLRSQTGLELDVIDHYNGGQRSVKSLSGGETFQASLSLALGLSDEVRLSAGGIKIDSMFVDEGFGTLDSESLQKAFKALSGITEGNRLVGIISHVDLLKEKIDKQIIVKKEHTGGSTVQLVL